MPKLSRKATLLALVIAAFVGVGLFSVSYEVKDLEKRLAEVGEAIQQDRQAIHVLKAEWAHLNEPRRLRELAGAQLGLAPIQVDQLSDMERLPWRAAEGLADDQDAAGEHADAGLARSAGTGIETGEKAP